MASAIIFIVILSIVRGQQFNTVPLIKTNLGFIKGEILESRLNNQFSSFRGIPFAEAPIGNLRFQDPLPKLAWLDYFHATHDGPPCPQLGVSKYSEDCLHLNVYTKNIKNNVAVKNSSVIVYFYGGGFVKGSNIISNVGPEYIIDRDIVFVVANYRVGAFGFLSTGTIDCPGNAGFKDQILALKWVRDNIASFGGNPNSVTIMGQSTGAKSIVLHMTSPMAKGLFHRIIAMSVSSTSHTAVPYEQIKTAKKISSHVGCPLNSFKKMIKCLQNVSTDDILSSYASFKTFGEFPWQIFQPIIERDFGQEQFLTEDPNLSLATGRFHQVPIIAGIVSNERASNAVNIIKDEYLRTELFCNFLKWGPVVLLYEDSLNKCNISRRLKQEFLTEPITEKSIDSLDALITDGLNSFEVHQLVHYTAKCVPVYYYKNSYKGRYSYFYYPGKEPYGVAHTDDLQYVIVLRNINPRLFTTKDPESEMVERMTRWLSNFAITGNPNDADDKIIGNFNWKLFDYENEYYLNIGIELKMENKLLSERNKVWNELFPSEIAVDINCKRN